MNEQVYNVSIEARERGERLRRVRNLANLSRKDLCDEAQININTYIGYEVGRYGGLTKKGADKVINHLSSKGVYCTLDWLMHGIGAGPSVNTDIQLKKSVEIYSETHKIKDELLLFHAHYKNAVDYQITDNGMFPIYEIGSYVAGIACFGDTIENLIGSDCIIQTANGGLIVRNLRRGRLKDFYTLTCINPDTLLDYPILYDEKISFAARIIWHRKPYHSISEDDVKAVNDVC